MVVISVDAGPTIVITSPVEGKSYKHVLTIEVIATDGIGLAVDGNGVTIPPTATVGVINVPLMPTGVDNTYRGTIDFDAQAPPLFGAQLLTVSGDQRQRPADGSSADLHHRQRGSDDHDRRSRFPVRSPAASC